MFSRKPSVKDEADIPNAVYQPESAWFYSWMIGKLVISLSMSSSDAQTHRPGATLHNRIAILRVEYGMSRQDLARELNISRQTVMALERGEYFPSLYLAIRIGQLFALPLEEIFFLSNDDYDVRKSI
jgi:putative transcriptional regulator